MKISKLSMVTFLLLSVCATTSQAYSLHSSPELAPLSQTETPLKPPAQDLFFDAHSSLQKPQAEFWGIQPNATLIPEYLVIEPDNFRAINHRKSVINFDNSTRYSAPEPATWITMSLGILGLILVRRRRNQ